LNTHFSMNQPRPLVPQIVEVGGLHLSPPAPLPQVLYYFSYKQRSWNKSIVTIWSHYFILHLPLATFCRLLYCINIVQSTDRPHMWGESVNR
jgi:hypothetical protein